MKSLLSVFIIICAYIQSQIDGIYKGHFGNKIELFPDKTFKYSNRFDLSSSWTIGKWEEINDTIYLKPIKVMDTLSVRNSNKKIVKDSLVLSSDEKINRIEIEEFNTSLIISGGQNRVYPPRKFYLKNEKLYRINFDGKIDKRKLRQFSTNKKYRTFYKKNK